MNLIFWRNMSLGGATFRNAQCIPRGLITDPIHLLASWKTNNLFILSHEKSEPESIKMRAVAGAEGKESFNCFFKSWKK